MAKILKTLYDEDGDKYDVDTDEDVVAAFEEEEMRKEAMYTIENSVLRAPYFPNGKDFFKKNPVKYNLFVYGTLKSEGDYPLTRFLSQWCTDESWVDQVVMIGKGTTRADFTIGAYRRKPNERAIPVALYGNQTFKNMMNTGKIEGEVWEIPSHFAPLVDEYEANTVLYNRITTMIDLDDGTSMPCYFYLGDHQYWQAVKDKMLWLMPKDHKLNWVGPPKV